jgi:hypothetical protein
VLVGVLFRLCKRLAVRGDLGHAMAHALMVLAAVVLHGMAPASAQPVSVHPAPVHPVRFEGVASCAGSTCHGRGEGNGAVVRQDELAHWQDPSSFSGAHSRAYSALVSARGQKIASALGLGPATHAGACLGCHSTHAPEMQRGARFLLSDGVGCESCHGASGGWLASHYTVAGSHGANVAAGMVALERPSVRASVCLDCHFGSDKPGHFVTHQMMAAGHPRVAYELDLFSALEQHWDEDGDYARRKGRSDHLRLWAVGQAEAVRRQAALFGNARLATQGLYPEFYFFDCHSCHRQIDDNPARARQFEVNAARPAPFGAPPFNDENMILLSAAARVLAPAQGAGFDAAARAFHGAMGRSRADAVSAGLRLEKASAALEAGLERARTGGDASFAVVAAIADKVTSPRFTDYTGAAQAVMATDTLLNALVRDGRISVGAAAGIRAQINKAYDAVKTPVGFNPAAFRTALAAAAQSIGALK